MFSSWKYNKQLTCSWAFQKFLGLLPVILLSAAMARNLKSLVFSLFYFFWIAPVSTAYRPGDIVPMSKMGQYHSVTSLNPKPSLLLSLFFFLIILPFVIIFQSRTVWYDVIGRQCPIFAVDREVCMHISHSHLSFLFEISLTFLCWFLGSSFIFCCYFVGFDSNNETHWLHRGWPI